MGICVLVHAARLFVYAQGSTEEIQAQQMRLCYDFLDDPKYCLSIAKEFMYTIKVRDVVFASHITCLKKAHTSRLPNRRQNTT